MMWMCLWELNMRIWRQMAGVWRSRQCWGWGRHGVKHCVWCLWPWRERSGIWKLGVWSFEEAWRHQNVSKVSCFKSHVIKNCVKATAFLRIVSLAGFSSCTIYSTSSTPFIIITDWTAAQRLFLVCLRNFYRCLWAYWEWGSFSKKYGWWKKLVREVRIEDQLVFIMQSSTAWYQKKNI